MNQYGLVGVPGFDSYFVNTETLKIIFSNAEDGFKSQPVPTYTQRGVAYVYLIQEHDARGPFAYKPTYRNVLKACIQISQDVIKWNWQKIPAKGRAWFERKSAGNAAHWLYRHSHRVTPASVPEPARVKGIEAFIKSKR
jgi:hypothetical protein